MDLTAFQDSNAWQWMAAHRQWLTPLIAGIAFLESFALVGLIMPGILLLYMAAFLAGSGGLPIGVVLLSACLGAIAGDSSSYLIGRYFHRHLPHIRPFSLHREWLEKGERFFHEYGGLSIVIGRFIGPIRPIMPLVAGALLMPRWLFFSLNISSAVLWAPFYMLPGYFAGAAIDSDSPWQLYVGLGIAMILILGIGAIWLRDFFKVSAL